ncbi:MAG: hypothetical protein WCE98_02845 [Chlorobium sp.]
MLHCIVHPQAFPALRHFMVSGRPGRSSRGIRSLFLPDSMHLFDGGSVMLHLLADGTVIR